MLVGLPIFGIKSLKACLYVLASARCSSVKELSDIPGVASVHRDGSISSYIEDPDGNSIEYIYWPPKT